MRWRALLLSGLFAGSIGLGYVSNASADPPPWAGRWQHNKHYNGDSGRHWKHDGDWRRDAWRHDRWLDDAAWRNRHDDDWRQRRQEDYWRWRREQGTRNHDSWSGRRYDPRYDGRYSSGYGYPGAYNYGSSAVCSGLDSRIARDQSKINEFSTTGRHQKARRWFENDMQRAMNDRSGC